MISRRITPRRTGRRYLTALAAGGLLGGVLLSSGTALAVHNEGLFELDTSNTTAICTPVTPPCGNANVADDPNVAGDDWANVFDHSSSAFATTFKTDPVSSAENSFYTGGGSKDVRDIPAWAYATSNDVVPDKDDIAHLFAAAYNTQAAETILYFGMDRYDNNGDSETGFWFFQDTVSTNGSGGFTGKHTVGDVLVLADWGGSNPVGALTVYEWMGGKNPLVLLSDTETVGAADCAKVGSDDNVCAVVNRQTVNQPWDFKDKAASTSIRPLELFEAGINLSGLGIGDRCFATFLGATRSSHSTTAQLKDFALGNFEQCGAGLTTQVSDETAVLGDSVTDTATVTGTGGATPPAPTGDVDFTVSYEGGTAQDVSTETLDGTSNPSEVTSDSVTLDKAGTWCFSATWAGDDNYTDGPYTDDGTNECVEVSPNQPDVTTDESTNGTAVTPGTEIWDTATLDGSYAPSNGVDGTITWTAYGPEADDQTCDTVAYTSTITVTGDGTYDSRDGDGGAFEPTDPGNYNWIAVYTPDSGDVNNLGATTECGDANEGAVVEQFNPSLTTDQTWTVSDSATITVAGGGNLDGVAHFALFDNSTCDGTALYTEDVNVSGASGTSVSTQVTLDTTFTSSQATLYWQVSYTSNNAAQTGIDASCTENSSLTIDNG